MPDKWKEIKVFISSTFNDMRAERDHLVKVVFPELREKLERHRIHIMDVDLRWGVTEEQERNNKVVDCCLEQVDACRPFFIGILGERWGWTPDVIPGMVLRKYPWTQGMLRGGLSLTAMEIHHGAFQNTGEKTHTFFYFRDPAFLKVVSRGTRAEIFEERDEQTREKLVQLKGEIRRRGLPVMDGYPCRWDPDRINPEDGTKGRVSGLDRFGEQVKADLWRACRDEFGLSDEKEEAVADETPVEISTLEGDDWLDKELDRHRRFIESRLRIYVGRVKLRDALMAYVEGNENSPRLATGPPGCGKSSALGKFYNDYSARRPGDVVIPHFVGASPRSTSLDATLRRFCAVVKNALRLETDIPNDPRLLPYTFNKLLQEAPPEKRILIVFDGVNQLDESGNGIDLAWLPRALPENVKILISCIDEKNRETPFLIESRERGIPETRVEPLAPDERLEIIKKVPSLAAKTLDREQVDLLKAKPGTENPLYLQVALEELRGFGSFEGVNDKIERFPNGLDALFSRVIERLEEDWSQPVAHRALSLLAASRNGLRERELAELTKEIDKKNELFVILRQLRPYLLNRGPLVDFYHRSLFKAVKRRYLPGREETLKAHVDLAGYFLERGKSDLAAPWKGADEHTLSELRLHLVRGQMWDELEGALTDLFFLEACARAGQMLELLSDMRTALSALPENRPCHRILTLLTKALNADIDFISRRPDDLFQTVYNRCSWYDDETAEKHYQASPGKTAAPPPWARPGPRLRDLMVAWRQKRDKLSGKPWIRSHRPPADSLESSLITVLDPSMYGSGHPIKRVAVSEDMRLIASGNEMSRVYIWLAETGALVREFDLELDEIIWVGFLQRSHILMAAAKCGVLVRLDLDAMREDRRWRAGEAGECFTMDVEGRWIGQGRKDGSVRLWKGEYDRSPRTFYNHGDYVTAISIDVESKLLASGSLDGVIVIRKFNTRTILRKVNPLGGPIHDWEYSMDKDLVLNLAFSPNGKRLAAVYVNFGCCMFDSITGDLKWRIQDEEEPGFRTAVFHPDGKRVALGGNEGPMQIRSVETGELFSVKTGHQDAMNDVAFSADGKWCISGSSDGQVRPWRLTGRTVDQLERTEHGSRVCQLAFSPDGKLLASGNFHYPISVIAWDVETGLPIHVFPCPNITIKSVVIDLANRLLAAGSEGGDIWVWDLESERLVNEFSIQNKKVTRLFFDSTGQRLVSGAGGSEIQLWDLQKGAQLMKAECDYASRPVMQSRAPGFFLAFHNKGTLFLWNMRSGKEIKRFEPLDGHIQAAAFCPAGRFMAMGSSTGRVEIVDLKYGLKRRTLNDLGHSVGALAFNPDGSLLAAASCKMGFARVIAVEGQSVLGDLESAGTWWAYTERLENAANGEKTPPIESFRKEDYSFCSVGFSPDGKFVGLQLTDGGSILYALEDGRIEDMNPYRPVCGDFFSDPSETRWCLSGEKRESLVYDRSTRKKVAHYPGSFDHVIASPTDPAIFAAYKRGRIEIFSVQTS